MLRRLLARALAAWLALYPTLTLATVTANIANAPGWEASTAYSTSGHLGNRVLTGAGWNPGSDTFNNGSTLYLIEETSCTSDCKSGSSQPTVGSCPSSGITDNHVTWQCLTVVDNSTITGHFWNNTAYNPTSGTNYYILDYVVSDTPPRVYRNVETSTQPCVTAGVTPTGTTATGGSPIVDGSCRWAYGADINYASSLAFPVKDRWTTTIGAGPTGQLSQYFVGVIWSGGVARANKYIPGTAGEMANGFVFQNIGDFFKGDGTFSEGPITCPNGDVAAYGCYGIIYEAAPGDSFRDLSNIASLPLRYDPTRGVSIEATGSFVGNCFPGICFSFPAGVGNTYAAGSTIYQEGWPVLAFIGLQIQSSTGSAFGGGGRGDTITPISGNKWLIDVIADSGGTTYGYENDDVNIIENSLIVARGTGAGTTGVYNKYPGLIFNSTIIGNNATNGTAMYLGNPDNSGGNLPSNPAASPFMQNVLTIGFPNFFATDTSKVGLWVGANSSNNATDSASGNSGTYTDGVTGNPATIVDTTKIGVGSNCSGGAGSCFSLTPSAVLVNPTIGSSLDARLAPNSPVIGAGASFSYNTTSVLGTLTNALDLLAQARPNGSVYSPGAIEFYNVLPPVVAPALGIRH